MRKSLCFLISLFCALGLRAQTALTEKPVKHEVRAAWVTIFHNMDWPHTRVTDEASRQRQKQELCTLLDKLQHAGFNTVLFQARVGACTAYPSDIEPWHKSFTGREGGAPGYDPLAFAVEECHKRGMEIQCWIAAIPVGAYNDIGARRLREKGFPMRRFQPGTYLDPSYEKVPGYLASVCREMTARYDIDGIHLDFIRYTEEWPRARTREEADSRRANITRIVKAIHDAVKKEKPWVKMSCSPLGKYADLKRQSSGNWNGRDRVYQESQEWVKNGLMDQLYPMMYYLGKNFYPFAADWQENSHGRTIAVGLGTYFLDPKEGRWKLEDVARQMMVVRQLGLGTAHFSAVNLDRNQKGILNYTADTYSPYPALVPPMTWASAQTVPAPTDVSLSDSTLSWQGSTPYYNVYASDTNPVDITDARNLIVQRYEGTTLSVADRHGNVPRRYFAVTAMDRYGVESAATQSHTFYHHEQLLANNGEQLDVPSISEDTRCDILTLTGQRMATRREITAGKLFIGDLPEGAYIVRTAADRKGRSMHLGAFTIKPRSL